MRRCSTGEMRAAVAVLTVFALSSCMADQATGPRASIGPQPTKGHAAALSLATSDHALSMPTPPSAFWGPGMRPRFDVAPDPEPTGPGDPQCQLGSHACGASNADLSERTIAYGFGETWTTDASKAWLTLLGGGGVRHGTEISFTAFGLLCSRLSNTCLDDWEGTATCDWEPNYMWTGNEHIAVFLTTRYEGTTSHSDHCEPTGVGGNDPGYGADCYEYFGTAEVYDDQIDDWVQYEVDVDVCNDDVY